MYTCIHVQQYMYMCMCMYMCTCTCVRRGGHRHSTPSPDPGAAAGPAGCVSVCIWVLLWCAHVCCLSGQSLGREHPQRVRARDSRMVSLRGASYNVLSIELFRRGGGPRPTQYALRANATRSRPTPRPRPNVMNRHSHCFSPWPAVWPAFHSSPFLLVGKNGRM